MIEKIKGACEPLLQFPTAAPARDRIAPGLRVTFSGNYAVYFVHDESELTVVRVLHGARDVSALAEQGAFGAQNRK